ncbi:hypothetical protein GIB67_028870 [Kingdonia uniflora]|uniref:Phosphatidic acid phosphatase type 2/haloperoxidase domain-containing protein n=1 Tax=Kingdonia uniflora TaxID=39325 RepID=A0A7J7LT92_9MAGN|nr:hypothetical protein GIB67_028870 [Kingdonia uniflora]
MDQYDDETLELEDVAAAAATAVNLVLLLVEATQYDRTPSVNRREYRNTNLRWLYDESDIIYHNMLRMNKACFISFCDRLRWKGLRASKHLDVEEHVTIFLLIVGHDTRYYVVCVGRVPGVYEIWEKTYPQVSGFRGAIHRRVNSRAEADHLFAAFVEKERHVQGGVALEEEEAPPAVEVEEAEDVEDLGGMVVRDVYGWIFYVVLACVGVVCCKVKMPEIMLGAHTVKSHGFKVARFHMHDWIILMLMLGVIVILNVIEPFHRFVGNHMMTDLMYPYKSNTVPTWAVPIIAVLLPFIVFIVYYYYRRDVYDLHHAILGILFAVFITGVMTDAIKVTVGRPRPDFFWRCFPNGKRKFDPITLNVICHGDKKEINEGYKSFPSGHTSWSFAGLAFLAWYLAGKIRVFDRRGHVAKLCIVFLPFLAAALVAVSRVDDYRHHWEDVFTGALLGTTVASFCYLQFFPPPYDIDGTFPLLFVSIPVLKIGL